MYESEAAIYKALGEPFRLRILALLREREACVCELADLLPISQPAVSQHLRKLREAGLVGERRQRYWTYYSLREDLPEHIARLIAQLPHDTEGAIALRASRIDLACSAVVRPRRRLAGAVASPPSV